MKKLIALLLMLTSLLAMAGCSSKGRDYSYNNLTSEQCMNELNEVLALHDVPYEDIDALISFVCAYNKESYAEKSLQGGWKIAKTTEHLYDYNEAITAYTEAPFEDLSCREAAFIIYNSFIKVPDDFTVDIKQEESPLFSDLAILSQQRELSYYDKYESLFCSIESEESVSNAVVSYWKQQNIEFEGNGIQLVTLWGKKDGKIINIHCGVLLEDEKCTYFFEKTDPVMPYQISIFDSSEDIKSYLINRPGENEYDDKTVLVDDKTI